jgi:hypothetical protein
VGELAHDDPSFVCECGYRDWRACTLSLADYEAVRRNGRRFLGSR